MSLSSRRSYAVLALLPLIVPTAWVLISQNSVSHHVTIVTGIYSTAGKNQVSSSSPPVTLPSSIPADVTASHADYVLAYEQIFSHPIPADRVAHFSGSEDFSAPDAMLIAYLQAAFESFTWMPQAFIVRAFIKDPALRRTFDTDYIHKLAFMPGDVVGGVFHCKYQYRGSGDKPEGERIEYAVTAPDGYRGPPVSGLGVAEVRTVTGSGGERAVQFVQETWIWRRREAKPTHLETALGKWVHSLQTAKFVMAGIRVVTEDVRPKSIWSHHMFRLGAEDQDDL